LKVKTARELVDLYYESVGRGGSFLLNVPPDRRGLIYEADADSLRGFGKLVTSTFAQNLALRADCKASNVRGGDQAYGALHLVDGDRSSYWSTDDSVTTPDVRFEFPAPVKFNIVRLRENIRLGQRVAEFAVDVWLHGRWSIFAEGTSIGICRILRAAIPVTTTGVRLRVTKSTVCPALSEFGLFSEG
jgi:alpha-L-fucosidase